MQCEIRFIIYSPVMNNSVSDSYSNFTGVLQKKKKPVKFMYYLDSLFIFPLNIFRALPLRLKHLLVCCPRLLPTAPSNFIPSDLGKKIIFFLPSRKLSGSITLGLLDASVGHPKSSPQWQLCAPVPAVTPPGSGRRRLCPLAAAGWSESLRAPGSPGCAGQVGDTADKIDGDLASVITEWTTDTSEYE